MRIARVLCFFTPPPAPPSQETSDKRDGSFCPIFIRFSDKRDGSFCPKNFVFLTICLIFATRIFNNHLNTL